MDILNLQVLCMLSSHVQLCVPSWTVACRAPLSMGFSRQVYRVGCQALLQGIFLAQGLNPHLLHLLHWQAGSLLLVPPRKPFWRRQWHPTPVLLPGKSHGWKSLVGCSPWGREESDTTERLHFHFSLSCIGEGNGNPLQCSCLEIPRDGGVWWLPSMGSHRVGHDWSDLAAAAAAAYIY